jgi:hypothetical protein
MSCAGHRAGARARARRRTLHLGGENLTYAELFALIHRVVGRQVACHHRARRRCGSSRASPRKASTCRDPAPPLTPDALRALGARLAYSSAKAERELGIAYEPAPAVIERRDRRAAGGVGTRQTAADDRRSDRVALDQVVADREPFLALGDALRGLERVERDPIERRSRSRAIAR